MTGSKSLREHAVLWYRSEVDLKPIIATTLGIAFYRAVGAPLIERYLAWKRGPRVQVARRNWRGIYVPDLGVKRGERLLWIILLALFGLGAAVGWTVMTGG